MHFYMKEEVRNALRIWRLFSNADVDSLVERLLFEYLDTEGRNEAMTWWAKERYEHCLDNFRHH